MYDLFNIKGLFASSLQAEDHLKLQICLCNVVQDFFPKS